MTNKKIAVIGGGIVGSTAAYYLSRNGHQVTVFDEGIGQATSAAAGIICPWLSKRRNKKWYRLASDGAAFYSHICQDITADQGDISFYNKNGAILTKKTSQALEKLYALGLERRHTAPEIGDLKILSKKDLETYFPSLPSQENALFVSGGARVDGEAMVRELLTLVEKNGGQVIRENVPLEQSLLDDYDKIIIAAGAWLPQLLEPLSWNVDIRGQKGQLVVLQTDDYNNQHQPVMMPEGEIDILPIGDGIVFIGASHENDKGYDLLPDEKVIQNLIKKGKTLFDILEDASLIKVKVGTRAYTSDFSPFWGYLPGSDKILVASGLGSSGLTTGPIIGYQLALLADNKQTDLPLEDYLPDTYLQR